MVAKHQFVLPCRILCYASVCHKKEDVHITFTCQVIKRRKEELLQKKWQWQLFQDNQHVLVVLGYQWQGKLQHSFTLILAQLS